MTTFAYQPAVLAGVTDKASLRCDPDGYYDVVVGAFDAYNSTGAYYTFNSAKAHFDASHHFQRRIKNGALYGEMGHPKFKPGMSKQDWLIRVMTIDEQSISHHIRELYLEDGTHKNKDGSPMVTVYARVKPQGRFAQTVADSLESKYQNTAFSIRSITDDFHDPVRGITIKNMREIITYDFVVEPGIHIATKSNNPGLEGLDLHLFTDRDIARAYEKIKSMPGSLESLGLEDRFESLLSNPVRRESGFVMPNPKRPPTAYF